MGTLGPLRAQYPLRRNERLRQYEVPRDGFGIDVHVAHFSTMLAVPAQRLLADTVMVQGFVVPPVETLLALKLTAWLDRRASVHGDKDLADIQGLLPLLDPVRWSALPSTYACRRRKPSVWLRAGAHWPRWCLVASARPSGCRTRSGAGRSPIPVRWT